MRFKVGDKVRVRTWESLFAEFPSKYSDHLNIRLGFNDEMKARCGKVVTISSVDEANLSYKIEEDIWSWSDEMFEKHTVDTVTTTVIIPLRDVPCKEKFTIAGIKMTKLRQEGSGWLCAFASPVFESTFGENQNYAKSEIHKKLLSEILPQLEENIGSSNLLEFNLNLQSYDDPNKYLDITTKIGIPSWYLIDEGYRDVVRGSTMWLTTAYERDKVLTYGSYGLDAEPLSRKRNVVPIICLADDVNVLYEN